MAETQRQSKEIIASMFLRLSRGETVSKEEATKAWDHYNSFAMELESYKYIEDLDNSSGTNPPSPGHQSMDDLKKPQRENDDLKKSNIIIAQELDYYTKKESQQRCTNEVKGKIDEESVREENKKLQRELDDLKKSNDMLNKELETYKRKSEHSMRKRLEKGCNTDNTGQECAKPGHRLEPFRNGNRDEGLRYVRNKEEVENVCKKIKKLQRELESLKKSNDILNKEYEYYKRLSENSMSKRIEKGCNTDNSGEEWASQVHKLEQLKQKKLDEGLRYFKNREKGGQEAESTAMDKLRQRNQQLIEEKEKLNDQIKELRDRLSVIAGHKLTAGNPDIADLSDAFRPTKVAEEFGQLYDNEWTSAFDELQKFTDNEVDLTDILAMIVKDLDSFCSRAQQQQLDRLKNHALGEMLEPESHTDGHGPTFQKSVCAEDVSQSQKNHANRLLKDFRKSFGILSVPWLRKSFNKGYMSPFVWERKEVPRSKCLKDFAEKALGLVWVMKIQDPPMELTWCKRGDTFNKNMFNYYTNRGNTVKHCVWPAVLLHKDGPLMSKGVAQGM